MGKILGLLVLLVAVFIVGVFAIAIVWQWVVPDVFAGAVERGILPATLTWLQALKLWLLLLILGVLNSRSSK